MKSTVKSILITLGTFLATNTKTTLLNNALNKLQCFCLCEARLAFKKVKQITDEIEFTYNKLAGMTKLTFNFIRLGLRMIQNIVWSPIFSNPLEIQCKF